MNRTEDRRLRAAVIGAGFGGGLSITALERSARFDLVAVCDLREDARAAVAAQQPDVKIYADHHALLHEIAPDVVCVATLPPTHEAIVMDVLPTPLHGILVEKPLGDTAQAGRRIVDAVRERSIPAAVPHNLLVAPHAREIADRVRKGEIGDLKLVEVQNQGWDIINAGIHWMNFFVALTPDDPCVEVMALADRSTRTFRDGMQVETLAVTSVQTRSGVRCVMHTGDHTRVNAPTDVPGRDCCFRLVGTKGWIEFWGWENAYTILNAAHPHGARITPGPGERTGHQVHLEALADRVAGGQADITALERSLVALEICEGAYRSSRQGRAIALPLGEEDTPLPVEWDPGRPYSGTGGGRDGRKLDEAA